jgi:ubiquinone/menaquinone biosynthesis C-methylase UbiE
MNLIPKKIIKNNSLWKRDIILPFLKRNEKILDFGCGDLSLAKALKEKMSSLNISGVDVVDFPEKPKNIFFRKYDGKKLPFKKNEFDTVISFYVYHHCDNAERAFKECLRVATRVLIVESLPRNTFEKPFVNAMDWLYNIIKPEPIPLTYQFHTEDEWKDIIKRNKAKVNKIKEIASSGFPIITVGKQCVIEIVKTK